MPALRQVKRALRRRGRARGGVTCTARSTRWPRPGMPADGRPATACCGRRGYPSGCRGRCRPAGWSAASPAPATSAPARRASAVALSGPNPLGGPADMLIIAEEPGVGLGAGLRRPAGPRSRRRLRGRPAARHRQGRQPRGPALAGGSGRQGGLRRRGGGAAGCGWCCGRTPPGRCSSSRCRCATCVIPTRSSTCRSARCHRGCPPEPPAAHRGGGSSTMAAVRIDLHVHSSASDGTDAPAEVIRRAAAAGLDVVALTDHDTLAGIAEAAAALPPGLTLVPGMELSCPRSEAPGPQRAPARLPVRPRRPGARAPRRRGSATTGSTAPGRWSQRLRGTRRRRHLGAGQPRSPATRWSAARTSPAPWPTPAWSPTPADAFTAEWIGRRRPRVRRPVRARPGPRDRPGPRRGRRPRARPPPLARVRDRRTR